MISLMHQRVSPISWRFLLPGSHSSHGRHEAMFRMALRVSRASLHTQKTVQSGYGLCKICSPSASTECKSPRSEASTRCTSALKEKRRILIDAHNEDKCCGHEHRTLVLCFDGTGEQFDESVSQYLVSTVNRILNYLCVIELQRGSFLFNAQER